MVVMVVCGVALFVTSSKSSSTSASWGRLWQAVVLQGFFCDDFFCPQKGMRLAASVAGCDAPTRKPLCAGALLVPVECLLWSANGRCQNQVR